MSTQTVSTLWYHSTDAEFRTWGSALSTAIGALLTRVVQTGDINWATVSKPATLSVAQGFEVFRLNDTLHSTAPLYFKFEYGSGVTTANVGIWLTIGKGVDGSGNLTDVIFARTHVIRHSGSVASNYNTYLCNGDGSEFALVMGPAASNSGGGTLVFERSRDGSGVVTDKGFIVQYTQRLALTAIGSIASYATSAITTLPSGLFMIPFLLSSSVSLAFGTVAPFFPATVINSNGDVWTPRSFVGVSAGNVGVAQVVNSMWSGRTYMGTGCQFADAAGQTYASTAMIWQ